MLRWKLWGFFGLTDEWIKGESMTLHRMVTDYVGVEWVTTETNDLTVCLWSDWLCWNILTCEQVTDISTHLFSPPLSPHCSSLIPTTPSLPLSFDPLVPWRGSYTAWRSCFHFCFLCCFSVLPSFTAWNMLSEINNFSLWWSFRSVACQFLH